MAAEPPHVLLLEDDPLMQRFVTYALEDEPLCLTCCDSVSQALAALEQTSFDWILTDLMLPGESGLSFIEKISHAPDLLGQAQIVALSAGIDLTMQAKLEQLGVVRQLLKPVSVKTLQELFQTEHREKTTEPQRPANNRNHAISTYFAGQHDLFERFEQKSRLQFAQDMLEGDKLLKENNFVALHNLAHSLKSALLLLGENAASHQAKLLEELTKATNGSDSVSTGQIQAIWLTLKHQLAVLSRSR